MEDKEKASNLIEFWEDEWDSKAVLNLLKPILKDEDLANIYDELKKEGVI